MHGVIRDAEPADLASVVELMKEFADQTGLMQYLDIDEVRLRTSLFRPGSFVRCAVSVADGKVVGYAMFYPAFSSFKCQEGLYLEDIFVTESARGSGVGLDLLRHVARRAAAEGLVRIDLMVDIDNVRARDFYFRHGAAENGSDRHFKFEGDAFSELARNVL